MINNVKLRRCPFCQSLPTHIEFCFGGRGEDDTMAVCCTNRYCEAHGSFHLSEDAAIQSWQDGAVFESILFRYIDRLSDPVDTDPLEKIVNELIETVNNEITKDHKED